MYLLTCLLGLMSITTLINIILMYWIPIILPFSSFVAARIVVLAFIEKEHWLILFSLLICVLLFLSACSISRKQILLPGLSLAYLVYDFLTLLFLMLDGIHDGYWKTYIIHTTVPVALIVLLCSYCLQNIKHHQ